MQVIKVIVEQIAEDLLIQMKTLAGCVEDLYGVLIEEREIVDIITAKKVLS